MRAPKLAFSWVYRGLRGCNCRGWITCHSYKGRADFVARDGTVTDHTDFNGERADPEAPTNPPVAPEIASFCRETVEIVLLKPGIARHDEKKPIELMLVAA